ncbi:MAG TPA: WD40 repeat domain-containing protein [Anaerolineae bacterium]|nr:WD40 repeat domain-containing protein [Anaerolineae bacterium]
MTKRQSTSSTSGGCWLWFFLGIVGVVWVVGRALIQQTQTSSLLPPRAAGCPHWGRWSPYLSDLMYTPDGATLLILGEGLAAYDAVNERPLWCVDSDDPEYLMGWWALSPDGETLAVVNGPRTSLTTWRVADGVRLQQWSLSLTTFSALTFAPDGRSLVISAGRELWRWPLHTLDNPHILSNEGYFTGLALAPDGRTLAVLNSLGLEVWDTATWTVTQRYADEAFSSQKELAFSPDGDVLAAWGYRDALVFRPASGTMQMWWNPAEANFKYVNTMVFSPDGRYVAALAHGYNSGRPGKAAWPASWDILGVWQTQDWRQVAEESYSGVHNTLTFTPDGASLLLDAGRGVQAYPLTELLTD